jgi:four helix bundle protein
MQNLQVAEKAHELVLAIYRDTSSFPGHEIYGLTSQMRRSATSIPSNIFEGKAKGSPKEFLRFLMIARGSLEELKYQLRLSKDLAYLGEEKYNQLILLTQDVGRKLSALIFSVRKQIGE